MGGKNSYESIKRYEDKAYDKVLLRLPKGHKAEIQAHAAAHGKSVNGFINEAIEEKMERDNAAPEGAEGLMGAKEQAHAQSKGMSLNAYIVELIERDMEQGYNL